jgi:hypothetical protein
MCAEGRIVVAASRKKPSKRHPVRPGTSLGETNGEPTLIGAESWLQLSRRPPLSEQEHQRHRIRRRAVLGLMLLWGAVVPLGMLAMIGVAAAWFAPAFALAVLALTLTPLFAAWRWVVRWAFRPDERGAG